MPEPAVSCCLPRSRADLLAAGVGPHGLAGPRWRRCLRGWYVPAAAGVAADGLHPIQRILDVVPLLSRGDVLTGWAAAYAHGVRELDGLDLRMRPRPVALRRPGDAPRRPTSAVEYRRGATALTTQAAVRFHDHNSGALTSVLLPTTETIDAVLDEVRALLGRAGPQANPARALEVLTEATVVVDAWASHGLLGLDDVSGACAARPGARGIACLRSAAAVAHGAVRSPWESRLRVLCVVRCGLPPPRVNVPVYDGRGNLLGIPDLLWPERGLVLEFDGAQHRERGQHRDDNLREERFEGTGLIVIRVDGLDMLRHRDALVARILDWYDRSARPRAQSWTLASPDVGDDRPVRLSDAEKAAIFASVERDLA